MRLDKSLYPYTQAYSPLFSEWLALTGRTPAIPSLPRSNGRPPFYARVKAYNATPNISSGAWHHILVYRQPHHVGSVPSWATSNSLIHKHSPKVFLSFINFLLLSHSKISRHQSFSHTIHLSPPHLTPYLSPFYLTNMFHDPSARVTFSVNLLPPSFSCYRFRNMDFLGKDYPSPR